MSNFKAPIFFVLMIVVSALYFWFNQENLENKIAQCVNRVLSENNISTLIIITQGRKDSPILSGTATQQEKEKITIQINKNCHIIELQDFIQVKSIESNIKPSLEFSIDNVNNVITITALVNNKNEMENIINSFNTAFNDLSLLVTLKHDIKVDRLAQKTDYDILITLLIPSIQNIQLAHIVIESNNMTVKGLVRDKSREDETIAKLKALFSDDLTIINQLELVVKHKPEIQKFKFELAPLPKIKQ